MDKFITTAELERQVAPLGVSPRAIRFWRSSGLLPDTTRQSDGKNGIRGLHPESVVARIRRIRELQSKSFTLEKIKMILAAEEASRDAEIPWSETAQRRLAEAEAEFKPPTRKEGQK